MKYLFFFLLFAVISLRATAQPSETDSLVQLLKKTPDDTSRVKLLMQVADKLYFFQPAVSLEYSTEALALARKLKYTRGVVSSLSLAGEALRLTGDYPGALKMQFEALEQSQDVKDIHFEARSLSFIGVSFIELREYRQALQYLLQARDIWQRLPNSPPGIFTLTNIGRSYDLLKMPDSALYYLRLAGEINKEVRHPQLGSNIPASIGNVYAGIGKMDSALQYYRQALMSSRISNESINMSRIQQKIAELYESFRQYDSSMYYARRAFADAQRTSQKLLMLESGGLLTRLYRAVGNPDSAFFYGDITEAMKDSLYGMAKFKQLQLLMLDQQQREQQAVKTQEQYRNRMKYSLLLTVTGVLLLLSFLLLHNNRQKQKAKIKIENAYRELKAAQQQLIQSEKMASLGELTAGIAHEIQNPLNFVNNFSEVSGEIMEEAAGSRQEAGENSPLVNELLSEVRQNLIKINHHGKRADAIVKGMLQHSRKSTGEKEPTDINALADEWLRLAYHGIRGKDNSFNVAMKTDFDPDLGRIDIIPQDIGRVLLNIINNAFYACSERSRREGKEKEKEKEKERERKKEKGEYQPMVSVRTKKKDNHAVITVSDNGNGIPQKVIDKIFQPFFTTKPTGQGTGLGLSLAYDIVKAHSGEITVRNAEDGGAEFIITLPVNL